jgi:hypothetical protein
MVLWMTISQTVEDINARIARITVDEIKDTLNRYRAGMVNRAIFFEPGTFVYRARKCDQHLSKNDLHISDLHYPRKNVRLGRANREGFPVFYACQSKEPVFFEMRVEEGDELVIGNWRLNTRLLVNSVGYTEKVFSAMGAARACPVWEGKELPKGQSELSDDVRAGIDASLAVLRQEDPDFDIVEAFGNAFTRCDEAMYKLSTAISELHLGDIGNADIRFGGVIYPSIQMSANSDNLALLPWFADNHLELTGVLHVRVTQRVCALISFDELDYATSFAADGRVLWNGARSSVTVPPLGQVTCYANPGVDEFGFYGRTNTGEPFHWVTIDPVSGVKRNFRQKRG